MRHTDENEWDEFHDPEIVDWRRVRAALEHENALTNHRITWLLSSQGFLFAAFALVFQASTKTDVTERAQPIYRYILAGLSINGILVSGYLRLGIQTAAKQHDKLEQWWNDRVKDKTRHPPLCGHGPRLIFNLPYAGLPLVFIFAWLIFLVVAFNDLLQPYADGILREAVRFAITLAVVALIFFLRQPRRSSKHQDESETKKGA